jgi:hypothetical protein
LTGGRAVSPDQHRKDYLIGCISTREKIPDRGEKVAVINKSAIKNKNAIKTEPMGVTRLLKINRMVIVETLIPLCWAITSTLSSYQYSTHTK